MPRSMLSTTGPTLGSARWQGDYLDREHVIAGGAKLDAAQFNAADAVVVNVGAAGALAAATSVPVDALPGPIPSGAIVDFGTNKFARLTAAAAAGATSLTVAAIPTALVDADVGLYAGDGTQPKYVPSGTLIGRTIAERDADTPFGVAADADDEVYLTAFDIADVSKVDDVELYRPRSIVYENFLPVWSALSSTLKGKVRAAYVCAKGGA